MESLGGTVLAIAALVAAMLLAATFVLALIAHFVAPERIEAVLEKLSLPRAAGVLVGGIEGALSVLLLLAPRYGATASAIYIAGLTGVLGVATLTGIKIDDCGCSRRKHGVDGVYFLRNALLVALAVFAAARSPGGLPVLGAASACAVFVIATAGLIAHRRHSDMPTAGVDESESNAVRPHSVR